MLHTRHTHTFIALIVLHACIHTYIHTYVYPFIHVHAFFSQAHPPANKFARQLNFGIYMYIFPYIPGTRILFFPFSLLSFFFFSGVPREQIFVTTKLWTLQGDADYEGTLAALARASLSFFLSFSFLFFLSH